MDPRADHAVTVAVALLAGELAAHYGHPPSAALRGALRAVLLELWDEAQERPTVPYARSPLPRGVR